MEYKFTSANFEEEVLNSEIPVLVDFYADWCGPCKMMAPIVESLAESFDGKVKVGKLNIDEEMDIAQKYRVMSIPTFIVFKGGQALETSVGAMSKDDLEKKLQKYYRKIAVGHRLGEEPGVCCRFAPAQVCVLTHTFSMHSPV